MEGWGARIIRFAAVLALAVSGQLAARAGALRAAASGVPLNLLLAVSVACLLGRGLLWVLVLRRERLVDAYPVLALAYPLVLALSALIFGEPLTAGKIAGSALVVSGVLLMSRPQGAEARP